MGRRLLRQRLTKIRKTMNTDNSWNNLSQGSSNIIQALGTGRRSSQKRWLALLLLVLFSAYVIYDSRDELLVHYYAGKYTEMKELIVLLFPLLFLFLQFKKTYKRAKFGDTPLVMNPFPTVLGQVFSGYIEINKNVEDLQFSSELLLMKQTEIYETETAETKVEMIWSMPVSVMQERAMLGVRLLLKADMPLNKPPSQSPYNDNHYFWQLSVFSHNKSFRRKWNISVVAADEYS